MQRFRILCVLCSLFVITLALQQDDGSLAQASAPGLADLSLVGPVTPEPAPRIPRHRVGHRAKVDNLDVLVAQGAVSDPLSLNRRLVEEGELIAAGQQGGDRVWEVYDLSVEEHPGTGQTIETQTGTGPLDVAVGEIDGIEIPAGSGLFEPQGGLEWVSAWASPEQHLMLSVRTADASLSFTLTTPIDTGQFTAGEVRVATGDVDADGLDEIVAGSKQSLGLYDTQGSLVPVLGDLDDRLPHPVVDLSTGDFDGDGDDEILVACGAQNIPTVLILYDVNATGTLVEQASASLPYPALDSAVTAGDLDGDGTDEMVVVAVVVQGVDHDVMAWVFQADASLETLTQASESALLRGDRSDTDPTYYANFGKNVDVVAGDMAIDVQGESGPHDEVYVVVNGDSYIADHRYWWVKDLVLTAQDGRNLSYTPLFHHEENGDARVAAAVGDLNMDRKDEVVLSRYSGLQVLQFNDEAHPMPSFVSAVFGTWRSGLAIGDLDGDGPHIGVPEHSTVPEVREIQVILNAPPTHYDVINGETHDVNADCNPRLSNCSYVTYAHQETENSEMILTSTRDWGLSAGLTGAYETMGLRVEASLKASYGENFEKTTREFEALTLGETLSAYADDYIYRTEAVYDVWEYPVYTSTLQQASEYILVVWPRDADNDGRADIEISHIEGQSDYSYYRPNHEIDNLLSYPAGENPPDDIATGIITDRVVYMGSNTSEFFVKWENVQESEQRQSSRLDLQTGFSVEASYMGASFKAELEGRYGEGELSTQKVGFQESTEIKFQFAGVTNQIYEYRLKPFVYWSSRGGSLIVDWTVDLTGDWWANAYNKPDLTFNLPWKRRACPGNEEWCVISREETREITFQPADPAPGETVTVTAAVHNYSLTDAMDNFEVRFYRNDPDQGGVPIGSDFVAGLAPRSSVNASATFTMPSGDGAVYIYAVTDFGDAIDEVHEDNNRGYGVLVEGNLRVTADDIDFAFSGTAGLSETVGVSATIEATAGTAVNAPIRFWDGQPEQNGQTIGWDTIEFLTAGEVDVAYVDWDTFDVYGPHTVCVEIEYEDNNLDDNLACVDVQLPDWPYQLHLPLVTKVY